MVKIDIISGFLGAGKTTLIKKVLKEALAGQKIVLIENEFGEIGVDGGFLEDAGIEIREMNSGCICCSLVGDFSEALKDVVEKYQPDRIIIEPSGVGKLSDVIKAVKDVDGETSVCVNSATVVVNAKKCKMYIKNFGEFFVDQVKHANSIILSRTGEMDGEQLEKVIDMLREHNDKTIVTTPWEELNGTTILETLEEKETLEHTLLEQVEHEYHHHGERCGCGGHEHHEHHHHGEGCGCGGHGHHEHHHHSEGCGCGGHGHHEHHHHHADEVFASWGIETSKLYTRDLIENALKSLGDDNTYGIILRAKGMLKCEDGTWIHFDYVPDEINVRIGKACATGKICVIGAGIKKEAIEKLFEA